MSHGLPGLQTLEIFRTREHQGHPFQDNFRGASPVVLTSSLKKDVYGNPLVSITVNSHSHPPSFILYTPRYHDLTPEGTTDSSAPIVPLGEV